MMHHFVQCLGNRLFTAFGCDENIPTANIVRSTLRQAPSNSNKGLNNGDLQMDQVSIPRWVQDPYFVGMLDTRDKIFIFFRETASEAMFDSEPASLILIW